MDQSNTIPAGEIIRTGTSSPTRNIVESVGSDDRFSKFAAALRAAGLDDGLAAKGPFTVFAPTDEAFKKLPRAAYEALLKDAGRLKAILSYHVIPGFLMARDVKEGEVMTLQGTRMTVALSSGEVRVNGARVIQVDLVATNGVVHAIDTVILPKNWQLLAAAA